MTEVYYPNSDNNSADRWPGALEVAYHRHNALAEGDFQAYVWWYIRRQYSPMNEPLQQREVGPIGGEIIQVPMNSGTNTFKVVTIGTEGPNIDSTHVSAQ